MIVLLERLDLLELPGLHEMLCLLEVLYFLKMLDLL